MSRGIVRERQVRALLEADGWFVVRAAGSLGDADLVALRAGSPSRIVEVKSTTRSAFADFGPADRAELLAAAVRAGAEPWLCWYPPRGKPQWIHADDWPKSKKMSGDG